MPPSELPRSTPATGRRRPLGAFIIILVLCLISFAIGIFIGKHNKDVPPQIVEQVPLTHPVVRNSPTPDNNIAGVGVVVGQDVVATSQNTVATPSVASEAVVAVATPSSAAQVAEQSVVANAELISENSPLGNGLNQPDPAGVVATTAKEQASPSTPAVLTVVKPVVETKQTVAKVVSHSGDYVVQVGSFKNQADAQKVQKKLQTKFAVQIKRADLGQKGVWYRVLVGPVASSAEANKVKTDLQRDFKLSGFVKKSS
ncbi:MAG: SPOR domain-containing protein [Desulfuromonas sp.]|nr:SPOR domain-containing protein [Desulfuromonas sp.]